MRRYIWDLSYAVAVIAVWEAGLRIFIASALVAQSAPLVQKDNEELIRLFAEDQSDREPKGGKPIDWTVVGPRDRKRLARVRELYQTGKLLTGADYYHTAMVLQHGDEASDYLLAHELCVVAIGKCDKRAKWLAAASEDRFLINIGRRQRFGTQYIAIGPNSPFRLQEIEAGVTDELRKAFDAPTLEEAKAGEAARNKKPEADKKP